MKLSEVIDWGLLADLPPAGIPGRLYFTSDTGNKKIYRDNGTTWDELAAGGSEGVTLKDVNDNAFPGISTLEFPDATITNTGTGVASITFPIGGGLNFGYNFVAPPLTGWGFDNRNNWVNPDLPASQIDTSRGTVFLNAADDGRVHGLWRAVPAPPYTITAALNFGARYFATQNGSGCGLYWRVNAGQYVVWGIENGVDSYLRLHMSKYASFWFDPDTSNDVVLYNDTYIDYYHLPVIWLRVSDDGANRNVSISTDGITYNTFWSTGRTDYITPTGVGFYGRKANAHLLSWEVT